MSAIDLVILGIIKQKAQSAYDIQKEIEYRNIAKWVRISKQSIYSKVLQYEKNGYVAAKAIRIGKRPEKIVYSLTKQGEIQYFKLLDEISVQPIHLFLDFNAVMMNLDEIPQEDRHRYLQNIYGGICKLKQEIASNMECKKHIPEMGRSILEQQYLLVTSLEQWISAII